MRRSKVPVTVIAVLAVIALVALPLTAGAAPATLVGKVTGSVQLGNPLQFVSFDAFDFANIPDRGQVNYTNFEVDDPAVGTNPGSMMWVPKGTYAGGVWDPADPFYINFGFDGGTYPHVMEFDSFAPLSYDSVTFDAHGWYAADPTFKWDATGTISNGSDEFDFIIEVTDDPTGYRWTRATLEGVIDPTTGAAIGNAVDDYVNEYGVSSPRSMTWSIPTDALEEVLSFSAPVTCALVSPTSKTATFTSAIPLGRPGGGNSFLITVTDNGVPGTTDLYNHGWASSGCTAQSLFGPYPVTAGNLTVHKQ